MAYVNVIQPTVDSCKLRRILFATPFAAALWFVTVRTTALSTAQLFSTDIYGSDLEAEVYIIVVNPSETH